MIAIAIAIVMLIFIAIFLLSSSLGSQTSQTLKAEYRNLYAHNALLSVLRTETECGTMSDVMKAAYFGGGKCDSRKFLDSRMPGFMQDMLNATGHTDFDWFIEASPQNFEGVSLSLGNPAVKDAKEKWDARTLINWEGYQLEAKLYLMTKV
jgi:hypothetical protein